MKAFIASMLLLTSVSSFSQEADLTDYYGIIVNNFRNNSHAINNFSNLKKTLLSGRCFDTTSTLVNGSALLLDTRPVNGGPIGNPDDTIPYVYMANVYRNPGYFDYTSYNQYFNENGQNQNIMEVAAIEYMADGGYANSFKNYSGNNIVFRQDNSSYIIYALNEYTSQACYYFIKN